MAAVLGQESHEAVGVQRWPARYERDRQDPRTGGALHPPPGGAPGDLPDAQPGPPTRLQRLGDLRLRVQRASPRRSR
jgi:hypothetical protein